MKPFDYFEPATMEEILALLGNTVIKPKFYPEERTLSSK